VQRLTHAHQHDVESHVEHVHLAREHANLADDFTCRQISNNPHSRRQAERALHRAPDLRREAERLGRCVRDEHGFDEVAIGQAQEELGRTVRRAFALDDLECRHEKIPVEAVSQLVPEVGHRRKIGQAPAMDPLIDLACVKARGTDGRQALLELSQIQFRDVGSGEI
jgi:hypothetical protein